MKSSYLNKILFSVYNQDDMPQLDLATFTTQVFWTFIIFSSTYFILLKKVLPYIAISLKLRNKLLNHYQNLLADLNKLDNSYIISKSNDLSSILTIQKKEIDTNKNYYSIINNSSIIDEYMNNYNIFYTFKKFPKIIKKKLTIMKKKAKRLNKKKQKI